jgi:hypothetical protein
MTVSDNTLISPNNSGAVAENLYNYLSVAQSIEAKVLFGDERPGDVISILHPYTSQIVYACIKRMAISMGLTELRANSEFLVNYTPSGLITGYKNYVVLTGTGVWQSPSADITVIIVEAGYGGNSGSNGESSTYNNPSGGAGGTGGLGGLGGRIRIIKMTVTPLTDLSYSCGIGGDGGAGSGAEGEAGTETTFNGYIASLGTDIRMGIGNLNQDFCLGLTDETG